MTGKSSLCNVRFNRKAQLVLVADTIEMRNTMMNAVRMRIAPWQALYKQFKDGLLCEPLLKSIIDLAENKAETDQEPRRRSR